MKVIKYLLIAAVSLIIVGLIIFLVVFGLNNCEFSKISTQKFEEKTFDITEEFTNLSVQTYTDSIEFVPSTDGMKVVAHESEKVKHTVSVENGELVITTQDNRNWIDKIGIFIGQKLTFYIPAKEYSRLKIESNTGSVVIPRDFTFESVNIKGNTGSIESSAKITKDITVKENTGSISISNVSASGDVEFVTNTGSIRIKDLTAKNCTIENNTGSVNLTNVIANQKLSVETSTGGINFDGCDGSEIYAKASTGSIRGTLLSEKIFIAKSSTGTVDVPHSTTGGRCEITTSTGSISIKIKE